MNPTKILIGLAPWALFALLTRIPVDGVAAPAAVAAGVSSLIILFLQRQGGVKVIDATSMIVFGVLAVVGFGVVGGDAWITDYGRATAALVLAVVMLISAITVPFTEQYARESVPETYWHTAQFRAINRTISALWGGIMLAMTAGHVVAAVLLQEGTNGGQFLLNWGLPVVLVIFGVKQTAKLSAEHPDPATSTPALR